MEIIIQVGTILGYVATAIGLFALIKTKIVKRTNEHILDVTGKKEGDKVHIELTGRLDRLEKQFSDFMESDKAFKSKMDEYIDAQIGVNRRVLANIIETTYYQNRTTKALDSNELRRVTEAYVVYHNPPVSGNHYITELYDEMMKWDRT